ncbi:MULTISPECIES: MFS transporter [Methanoculleus]|jgi:MFS family permease|uniref:MFS-type transporter involved in bile tolerance, Atg22 family n=1 Tax=Methanoculleus thermophilus TaxID=2200 RepID=A0A1G8X771_9EURY|nr:MULTISPECIES: MFS transporter [Methanoculleus]NLN09144.1 MFS transporter [Methanoculleus thermophilus]SDJ86156.1 MFS-type transporter involved in bile tolerance, Atg22 family [Methanoculleus thermophilus]HQD26005.1 MFS transporter [Methanoculleus thermophilus]
MVFETKEGLTDEEIGHGLKLVIWDGLATQAMVTLTGGIFLVAFALQLGASNTVIGLLSAISPLAELLQIPSIYVVDRIRKRRLIVVTASLVARLCWVPIILIPFFLSPGQGIFVLIASIVLYSAFSAISHCGWNSWMRDLIPQDRLGAFFSNRLTLSTALALVVSLVAGFFIDSWEIAFPDLPTYGYSVLFALGLIAGLIGITFLARTPEPRMVVEYEEDGLFAAIKKPFADLNFKNLIIFLASWNFAVNLASPFFTVYMLQRIGLDVSLVVGLSVLSQIMNIAFYRSWGGVADRYSNKSVLAVSGPLYMLAIFAWMFVTLPDVYILTYPLLILIHILMGISLAGVSLASGNIGLKLAPKGQATSYLAASTFANSVAAGVAPILGGLLVDFFAERELIWTLIWRDPARELVFVTLDLQQWEFFFLFAFILGLYSIHRLTSVQEEGEAKEQEVVDELLAGVRRDMQNFSSAGGLRDLVKFPFSLVRYRRKGREKIMKKR